MKKFISEYPSKLYAFSDFEGGRQATFLSDYLPKLTEVDISDDEIIDAYSGLILCEITSEGKYKGKFIEINMDF